MAKKKKNLLTKIVILVVLISFLLTTLLPLFAKSTPQRSSGFDQKQKMLDNITSKKEDLAKKLKAARLKESFASNKLRKINQKLANARREAEINNKYLTSNQEAWEKTKEKLEELQSQKFVVESKAKNRIISIYKKDQLRMIDGLVNSESPIDYMDYLYYQKRLLQYDNKLLGTLIKQGDEVNKYKAMLEDESSKIKELKDRLENIQTTISAQSKRQKTVVSKLKKERSMFEISERQLERESIKLIYKISELSDKSTNPNAAGTFIYPVNARITSPFGPRRHPIFGVRSMHSGIDLAAPGGTPIKASEGGLVIYSGWYGGYGKVIIIDHARGYSTLYAHMSSTAKKVGDRVGQGDVVGYEGSTGYATGPHLHFEVRHQGKPKNPVNFLTKG